MLEMAINNVEMGSELDRVHILTCCVRHVACAKPACKTFLFVKYLANSLLKGGL